MIYKTKGGKQMLILNNNINKNTNNRINEKIMDLLHHCAAREVLGCWDQLVGLSSRGRGEGGG
jgi:hypothetical protein